MKRKRILVLTYNLHCRSLHYNVDESYLHVKNAEIWKFNANDNISWYDFCLGSVPKDFTKDELSERSLNVTIYRFSLDHGSVKKVDILNIHQYLILTKIMWNNV